MTNSPTRILLVEDNEYDFELVQHTLVRSGFAHVLNWVQRGAEAIQQLQIHEFDIILLDYNLPDSTGLSIFEQILAAKIDSPVIFVTGAGDEQVAVEALKLGAQD